MTTETLTDNETSPPAKPPIRPFTEQPADGGNSVIFHVSVRAWLALLFAVTVCSMGYLKIEVTEPLYTLSVTAISFYFGGQLATKGTKGA